MKKTHKRICFAAVFLVSIVIVGIAVNFLLLAREPLVYTQPNEIDRIGVRKSGSEHQTFLSAQDSERLLDAISLTNHRKRLGRNDQHPSELLTESVIEITVYRADGVRERLEYLKNQANQEMFLSPGCYYKPGASEDYTAIQKFARAYTIYGRNPELGTLLRDMIAD